MSIPQLPTELLYDVLENIWSLTLTPAERVQFMTTSTLVSRIWFAVYDDILSKDIHIPSKSFYSHLFSDPTRNFTRCKRITFNVCCNRHHLRDAYKFLSRIDMKKLTSLRAINTVYYYNPAFPDPYTKGFHPTFPDYPPRLIVSYTYLPHVPLRKLRSPCRRFYRSCTVQYFDPQSGAAGEVNSGAEHFREVWEDLVPEREDPIRDGKEAKQPLTLLLAVIKGLPIFL